MKRLEDKELSKEDCIFMEIMESSATLQDGRYCPKLPFKKPEILQPNNFSVAKQRILGLRRKFVNNQRPFQLYFSYIREVTDKGYAEQVPPEQLQCQGGKVC